MRTEPFTLIWDWNGTLLDDAKACVDVMNQLLEKRGLPLLDLPRYREIFTFPVSQYYRLAGLDLEKEAFELVAEEYIASYNRAALSCGLCLGARDALDWFQGQGVRQAIASASHQDALQAQVDGQGLAGYFSALLGIQDIFGAGKAGVAKAWLRAQGADLSRVWAIGDSLHDWEVAQEMGCGCVLVAQGHQSYERLAASGAPVLRSLEELPAFWRQEGRAPI